MADEVTNPAVAAATPAVPATPAETKIELVAFRDLPWGDGLIPEGTVLAELRLPAGAPYSGRYVTAQAENGQLLFR